MAFLALDLRVHNIIPLKILRPLKIPVFYFYHRILSLSIPRTKACMLYLLYLVVLVFKSLILQSLKLLFRYRIIVDELFMILIINITELFYPQFFPQSWPFLNSSLRRFFLTLHSTTTVSGQLVFVYILCESSKNEDIKAQINFLFSFVKSSFSLSDRLKTRFHSRRPKHPFF